MITIIHGDDLKASRDFLTQKKQESKSPLSLDGSTLDMTQLVQALSGDGLFNEKKDVFIEQLFSKKKKGKELDSFIETLSTYSDLSVFLWEGKILERKTISLFPNAQEKYFKLPQMLFTFLDNIMPSNSRQLLPLYHEVLSTVEPEVLFAMITRQMRLLLFLKKVGDNPIDEVKRLQPWQVQKLKKQADAFSDDVLCNMFLELHEIDYKIKTGKSSLSLSSTIDIWLLKL